MEVHWKTYFLCKSTVPWLQFFYKYFTVLVVNNNCCYYRYFNGFSNAPKWKCKVQLITAIWNTGKLTQIVQGKAVHFTFKNTLFLLRRNHPIGNYNWQNWQLYDCNLMAGWEIGRVRNLQQRFFEKTTSKCNKTTGFTCNFSCKRYVIMPLQSSQKAMGK